MPLLYQPKPRMVVMCDFIGFIIPEMVKVRPVVVLSRHKRNRQLVTVVPLSTTAPDRLEAEHHALSTNPLPDKTYVQCWAKCDMVATVSLARLDRYKAGKSLYVTPEISIADYDKIRAAVASALNLTHNMIVPARGL
jgi:uncharacterized protein YifN (PemK superfamily)